MGKSEKENGRGTLLRPGSQPRRAKYPAGGLAHEKKWIRLDSQGKTSVVAMDRQKLTQRLGVQLRDLRILDPKFCTSYPSAILCRENALVVNLEHIKAILTPSYVLVMNPDKEGVVPFIKDLEDRLCSKEIQKCPSVPVLSDASDKKMTSKMGWLHGSGGFQLGNQSQSEHGPPGHYAASAGELSSAPDTGKDSEKIGNGGVSERSHWEQALPFELKALEVCLESICATLDELTTELEATAFPALDALTLRVNTHNLQRVRSIKSKMVRLQTRVETVREVLEKLLDDDGDMRAMSLTAKWQSQRTSVCKEPVAPMVGDSAEEQQTPEKGPISSSSSDSSSDVDEEVQEVEMLLEAYFMQLDNTLNRLHTLCNYTDDTEDFVNIQQDKHRNQLLQLELLITAGTFALSFIAVITGIFGMNLKNHMEENGKTFTLVSTLTSSGAVCVLILLIAFSRWKGLMFN
ncbi:hypothetical protein BSKO_04488 [Bryopsis sp. KO-2023]|nr:hypothetical protein BSKO_04488 [Bryopsis sp. KO-2023]